MEQQNQVVLRPKRKFQYFCYRGEESLNLGLTLVCIFLIALVGLHCGRSEDQTSLDNSKVTVLTYEDELIFCQQYWGVGAEQMMFLPLAKLERFDLKPQPALAQRWEHSEDYRKWTYFLRTDVKWHDGVPVTAHDVKFTMNSLQKGARWHDCLVEILDDFTLTITYKKPVYEPSSWAVYYPKHLLEGLDPEEIFSWDFWTQPVGNGPYRFVRHVPKTMIEVEANPDYYRGKPRIERVILKFSQLAIPELLSGNVDAMNVAPRDILLKLSGDDRFRSYHYWSGYNSDAIYWNHRHPLFKNREIRRALTMAINRRELAGVLNYPDGVPILDALPSHRQFRQGLYPEPLPYDPERTRRLLEADGWHDTDGNGVIDRAGDEFRFTAIVDSQQKKHAIYVQDQFRRIGIRMEIQELARSIVLQRFETGQFEAIFLYFSKTFLLQIRVGPAMNLGEDSQIGYANPEMIRLINLLKEDRFDPDERDRIHQKITPIFRADLPITLLLPRVNTSIAHRRIKGLSTPNRINLLQYMEYLWIEDEE